MRQALDQLSVLLVNTGLAVFLWTCWICLLIRLHSSPSRRVVLARLGLVGAWLMIPAALIHPWGYNPVTWWSTQFSPLDDPRVSQIALPSPPGWLIFVYVVWSVFGFAWILLTCLVCAFLVCRTEPPRTHTLQIFEQLVSGRFIRAKLRVTNRLHRPAVVGLFHPVVLIPATWEHVESPERLKAALSHELAHINHCDLYDRAFARLTLAFWFFVPVLRTMIRGLKIDHEIRADQYAASNLGGNFKYASALVALVGRHGMPLEPAISSVSPRATSATIHQRIKALLEPSMSGHGQASIRWTGLSIPVHMASLILFAGMQVVGPGFEPGQGPNSSESPLTDTFVLARLEVETPFEGEAEELPVPMPFRCCLEFETYSPSRSLPVLDINGLLITASPRSVVAGGKRESWRHVQVEFDGPHARFWIDGRFHGSRDLQRSQEWLRFSTTPGERLLLRNFVLRY